jgi:hypothetical protein
VKKILILTIFIFTIVFFLSGCQVANPEAQSPDEQPLITQYIGIINEVNENEILVYVIDGYNGEMIAMIDEETNIDDSLKQMIKPDNLISFKTNGIMTRSIPPQVIVVSIDSILEDEIWSKVEIDLSAIDEDGLRGQADGKVAVSYEYAILDSEAYKTEVKRIDQTVEFMCGSSGRIGAAKDECLCIGSTHQEDYLLVLQQLAELQYIERIIECHFE